MAQRTLLKQPLSHRIWARIPLSAAATDNSKYWQDDLVAGLTVGVMAIPQGVSFASMAGLPAQFGLYTAFVPVLTYCFFGGSRYLVWESSFAVELI